MLDFAIIFLFTGDTYLVLAVGYLNLGTLSFSFVLDNLFVKMSMFIVDLDLLGSYGAIICSLSSVLVFYRYFLIVL